MIIAIVGPTGTGKTDLSIEVAKKYNGEIINADSTQIFKGMDIATNKIKDTQNIKHHLLSTKEITEDYTVFDFQKDGRKIINDIQNRGKNPIIVGGTGLYIKALLYDYKFEDKDNNQYEEYTNEEIYNKLIKIDPKIDIHVNNRKRIINALNYCIKNNKKYSDKEKTEKLLYDVLFIGLTTNRDILYEKINKRVDDMIKDGLVKEAINIYNSNIKTKAVLTPIGYKELFPSFEGKKAIKECIEDIKQNSRRYAKRQYTWFNNQMEIKWFNVDYNYFENTVSKVLSYIENNLTNNIK